MRIGNRTYVRTFQTNNVDVKYAFVSVVGRYAWSRALRSSLTALTVNHRSRIRILQFFSFLKFNEFYELFSVQKNWQKIRNFANHRCLTCFDVLERNVHL